MSEKGLLLELNRIKQLMLFENFGANEKMIPKYIDFIVDKIGEKPFERFFEGEATLREFKTVMSNKIKSGDYGVDFGEVSKNLQYLKRMPAILGTLEREYKKDPEEFVRLDEFMFGSEKANPKNPLDGIYEKVLYGGFCVECKNPSDVMSELDGMVEKRKIVDKERANKAKDEEEIRNKYPDPKEAEKMLKKLYGDTYGLINFFTKGHIKRGQNILDKYNLRGYGEKTDMGKNAIQIELTKPLTVSVTDENGSYKKVLTKRSGEKFIAEYKESDNILIHKTKNQEYRLDIEMDQNPVEGRVYNTKILRVIPALGNTLEVSNMSVNISFKVLKMGTSKELEYFNTKQNTQQTPKPQQQKQN